MAWRLGLQLSVQIQPYKSDSCEDVRWMRSPHELPQKRPNKFCLAIADVLSANVDEGQAHLHPHDSDYLCDAVQGFIHLSRPAIIHLQILSSDPCCNTPLCIPCKVCKVRSMYNSLQLAPCPLGIISVISYRTLLLN